MMTKPQLIAELFRVKNAMRDAMLDYLYQGGDDQAPLYRDTLTIWKDMNHKNYN